MATLPAPKTWVAGEDLTAGELNLELRDALSFLLDPPRASVYTSVDTTMATSTATAIAFDVEFYDTDSMHDNVTNNSRLTINTSGVYLVKGMVGFASNTTGYREVEIRKNGSGVARSRLQTQPTAIGTTVLIAADIALTAGDYIQLFGWQNSGGNLLTVSGATWTRFEARWVGLA